MMGKVFIYTETLITTLNPERAAKLADQTLVEIRVVESRKDPQKSGRSPAWIYEYEVKGEIGRIEKFFSRVKNVAIHD